MKEYTLTDEQYGTLVKYWEEYVAQDSEDSANIEVSEDVRVELDYCLETEGVMDDDTNYFFEESVDFYVDNCYVYVSDEEGNETQFCLSVEDEKYLSAHFSR